HEAAFATSACCRGRCHTCNSIVLMILINLSSSSTVDVPGTEIRWYFGVGFWTCRLALDEIDTVAIVRNHWWHDIWPRRRTALEIRWPSPYPHRRFRLG